MQFMNITHIEDLSGYGDQREQYEKDVKEFYKIGKKTFLSRIRPIDAETFYMHVIRYYIPEFAKITFKKHQLGVGIFTMQGFERRNKESKNTLKRFSNNKGNIAINNVQHLYDVFYYDQNAV